MTMARLVRYAIVAVLLMPSAALAAPPPAAPSAEAPPNDEARAHYQRGVGYYKEGDYKLSLLEFRRAYDLSRNYRILYNLGRVHQQLNNYAQALVSFEQYLREGGTTIPADRREEVEVDVADLRGKTAHIEITVDVQAADVFVDGVPVGKTPLVAPILLDAGDHRVEVQRSGYESARRFVTLAARDSARVDVRLEESKARVVMMPTAPGGAPDKPPARSTAPLWISWGSAGALAVGAGVTGLLAANKASQLDSLVASPSSTADQRASVRSQAHGLALASDVLAVTAVAAGGVAMYFTLRPSGESGARPAKLAAGICGTGVCASGQF